jgi:hypothetical protein
MDKKYEIMWRNPQKTVLLVNYLTDIVWDDIMAATIEAAPMIQEVPHDVILFHNGGQHAVDTTRIGAINDRLYNKIPPRPAKNLKFTIVLIENLEHMKWVEAAVEILDKRFSRPGFVHVVNSMAEAEREISKAGF